MKTIGKNLALLIVLLLVAVLGAVAVFSYSNTEGLLGFLKLGGKEQATSRVTAPWWCMSNAAGEAQQKQWEDQKEKEKEKEQEGGGNSGTGDTKIIPFVLKNGFVLQDVYDLRVYLNGSTVAGGGDGFVMPPIPDVKNPPKDKPNTEPEWTNLWYPCSCDQTEVYVSEIRQTLKCPGSGSSVGNFYNSGQVGSGGQRYWVTVWKPHKADCDSKWNCPVGYTQDKAKVSASCSPEGLGYQVACNGKINDGIREVCDAFMGLNFSATNYSKGLVCVTKDQCAKYFEWASQGVFTKNAGSSISYDVAKNSCEGGGYQSVGEAGSHVGF